MRLDKLKLCDRCGVRSVQIDPGRLIPVLALFEDEQVRLGPATFDANILVVGGDGWRAGIVGLRQGAGPVRSAHLN